MDKSSFTGLIIGIGGIVAGLILEGGKISQILQPTAALIVFGGTLGVPVLAGAFPAAFAFVRFVVVSARGSIMTPTTESTAVTVATFC